MEIWPVFVTDREKGKADKIRARLHFSSAKIAVLRAFSEKL